MPIYGYGLLGAPWVLEKDLKREDCFKLINYIMAAKKEINDEVFSKTIKENMKAKEPYIATYDFSKSNIPEAVYFSLMDELINIANRKLNESKKFKNYKFDIMGSWSIGRIIIMKRNY